MQQDTTSNQTSHPGMWDGFEHAILFSSLCTLATSMSLLIHTFVDKWVPGVAAEGGTSTFSTYMNLFALFGGEELQKIIIRGYMSSLIIAVIAFSFLYLDIQRRSLFMPEMKGFRVRKFFIYLTLFSTFSILMGNLGSIFYQILSGNLTMNAMLHTFVTGIISGSIFLRYIYEVKQDRPSNV